MRSSFLVLTVCAALAGACASPEPPGPTALEASQRALARGELVGSAGHLGPEGEMLFDEENAPGRVALSDAMMSSWAASGHVTPSWYPTKQQTGKVVPTYDYAVVHAAPTPKPSRAWWRDPAKRDLLRRAWRGRVS